MASIQIPNLPAAGALTGTEQLEIVQAGVSVRATTAALSALTTITAGVTPTSGFTVGQLLYSDGNVVRAAGAASAGSINVTSATPPANGIYLAAANVLGFSSNSTAEFRLSGTAFSAVNATGPALMNIAASASVPTILPDRAQTGDGIGWNAGTVIVFSGSSPQLTMGGSKVIVATGSDLQLGRSTQLFITPTMNNNAGVATGTLTNAPNAGNPTKWVAFSDNGTTRYIPCW